MALTTLAAVQTIPGMANQNAAWLETLIGAASAAIKQLCKLNLELGQLTQFYSGNGLPDLVLRQWPLVAPGTALAASMAGLTLPQSTLIVTSTVGFPTSGTLTVAVSGTGSSRAGGATVTYTGTTATTFTGCAGGTGTLASGGGVALIAVYVQPQGQAGYAPGVFTDDDLWLPGQNYYPSVDSGSGTSLRGLLRATAGGGVWWGDGWGMWGNYTPYGNKLAATRKPCWPVGNGNVKVIYQAGYSPIPDDLQYACAALVASMVRNQPSGLPLQSENLGAYGYSVGSRAMQGNLTDLSDYGAILRRYREVSF